MVTMHGFFDLNEGVSEQKFKRAFDAFGSHLKVADLITSFRVMRRRPDVNYDSSPPATGYYVRMDFVDVVQSQVCWDYIESDDTASTLLHRAVYSQIRNYSFFLSEDILA